MRPHRSSALYVIVIAFVTIPLGLSIPAQAEYAPGTAPFINTWLLAGPLDKPAAEIERSASPAAGAQAANTVWRYFDDRLFCRNLDDYQDLRSYYRLKRHESTDSKVAYAHVYIHSEKHQLAQLRANAHSEFKAWLDGVPVAAGFFQFADQRGYRGEKDVTNAHLRLNAGWNRLLLRIRSRSSGRFGFYARVCDIAGDRLPDVTFSVDGPNGEFGISTRGMPEFGNLTMPIAYREWTYVGIDVSELYNLESMYHDPMALSMYSHWNETGSFVQASDFQLLAHGGKPPYGWSLVDGTLPQGLELRENGTISGIVAGVNKLGEHEFTVAVSDGKGKISSQKLSISLRERPNRWYDEAGLTALVHSPERLPLDGHAEFAELLKRQGYQAGIIISFNNGDGTYRWPSLYEPNNKLGDVLTPYMTAFEAAGIRFGMYMGPFYSKNVGGPEGPVQFVEDALKKYRPAVLWFDWGIAVPSTDSLFSMMKTINPDALVVLNGQNFGKFRFRNGDFDVTTYEGWNHSDEKLYEVFPYEIIWPKRSGIESWRLIPQSKWQNTKDQPADPEVALRIALTLIGEGHIANIDATPSLLGQEGSADQRLKELDGELFDCHRAMADWASPPGLPPIYPSFTRVRSGPLAVDEWGYSTVSIDDGSIYLHIMKNTRGKKGMPESKVIECGPVYDKVLAVVWMQKNRSIPFKQKGSRLIIDARQVEPDSVSTVIKISADATAEHTKQEGGTSIHVLARYRMGEYYPPELGLLPDQVGAADMHSQGDTPSVIRKTTANAPSDYSIRFGDSKAYMARNATIPTHFSYVLEAYVKPSVKAIKPVPPTNDDLVRIVTNGTAGMGSAIAARGNVYGIWAGYGGFVPSEVTLDPNRWVHLALVHDFDYKRRRTTLLVDHKPVCETHDNPEPKSGARIGGTEAGDVWPGLIDEVRFSKLKSTFNVQDLMPAP